MKTVSFSKIAASAVAACGLVILAGAFDAASARGGFRSMSVKPLSGSSLSSRNSMGPAQFGGRSSSYSRMLAPNKIGNSFKSYQPSNNSMGIHAPWATRTPYQRPMVGTPYQRAGACVQAGLC